MYPVVTIVGEEYRMEVVQTYNTAYAGFPGKHRDFLIEFSKTVRISTIEVLKDKAVDDQQIHNDKIAQDIGCQRLPVDSDTAGLHQAWSLGRVQFNVFLDRVKSIEEQIKSAKTFRERRDRLSKFLGELELRGTGEIALEFVYAIFLARNPSEIPHNCQYERKRRLVEKTVEYSGTENKNGRNWRSAGEMSFSVQARQRNLFNDWKWPLETATAVDKLVDIGPRDEEALVTAQLSNGETWDSLLEVQQATARNSWSEEWPSGSLRFGSPVPEVKSGILSVKQALSPAMLKQKALNAKRSVEWTWNMMEVSRSQFPHACGEIYIRKSVKKLCKSVGLYKPLIERVKKLAPQSCRVALIRGQVDAL